MRKNMNYLPTEWKKRRTEARRAYLLMAFAFVLYVVGSSADYYFFGL